MNNNLKARVIYYPDFHVGASQKDTAGYAIELFDPETNDWETDMFMQLYENEYIQAGFIEVLHKLYDLGYTITF